MSTLTRDAKNGDLLRFRILNAETRNAVRNDEMQPLVVMAYTAKAARHQAKKIRYVPEHFIVEQA